MRGKTQAAENIGRVLRGPLKVVTLGKPDIKRTEFIFLEPLPSILRTGLSKSVYLIFCVEQPLFKPH